MKPFLSDGPVRGAETNWFFGFIEVSLGDQSPVRSHENGTGENSRHEEHFLLPTIVRLLLLLLHLFFLVGKGTFGEERVGWLGNDWGGSEYVTIRVSVAPLISESQEPWDDRV